MAGLFFTLFKQLRGLYIFISLCMQPMRKSALNERIEKNYLSKASSKNHTQDLILQNLKFEPSKVAENNFMSSKTPLPYYHPKNIKQLMHRPYTTQKNQSYLDLRRDSQGGYPTRHEPAKQLSVSTMRDHRDNIQSQDNTRFQQSKGRLFRGSSWKYDDKLYKELKPVTSRYQQHLQHKRDISAHEAINEHEIKSRRSSGLVDLLGQNLKKSDGRHEEEFLEYIMRFSYRTKKGYIPTNSGKVNQDNYIVNPNLNGHTWQHFFAICDGHGPLGHHVSSYIKNTLPQAVNNAKGLERHPKEALTKAFEVAYEKLLKESKVDLSFSGSTVIGCYFNNNRLVCANVGDSRAILGRCKSGGSWETVALSDDHKPSVPKEAERIKKMRGRVEAFKDEYGDPIGPLRVWVQGDNVPGLAMTRSFGDLVGASVGVSPIPQIKEFNLTQSDRIVVIASDGIFQFLQNQAIITSLIPFYESKQIQQASDHLMSMATKTWTKNSSIIDDITFILIFISYNEM